MINSKYPVAIATFLLVSATVAGAVEVQPVEITERRSAPGVRFGTYAGRTLSVGIVVDRRGADVVSYTLKDRPYVRPVGVQAAEAYRSGEPVELELALLGPAGQRHTRVVSVGPLCFDHDPVIEPHVEGDTIRAHRDSFLVELPELAGFDRVEVAYRERYRGMPVRKVLGVGSLDRGHYDPAAGPTTYKDLAIAGPGAGGGAGEPPGALASTVLWPEDFGDPDIYRIDGDPAEGDRRVNIVIVPDGYTHANKALMEQHADDLIGYLRQTTPVGEHDRFVNYTLVYAYSVEEGTDQCDCGIVVDTAMGTRFPEGNGNCGDSANRCLSYGGGCDETGTSNIVAAELRAPFHDETIIMVNTTRYGGCAGSRSTYSAGHGSGEEVGTHELGHSVAGLADEYTSSSGCGTSGGNVNTSTNATEGAWPEWIADLGPPREGARYWTQCIYRPENSCKMRSLGPPFCAVCTQRWALTVFNHPRVSPTAPVETAVEAPSQVLIDAQIDFSITTRLATGAAVTNSIVWSVQEPGDVQPLVVATNVENYSHVFDQLGTTTVTCEVVADTNFVKPEVHAGNRDVITWDVEAVASVCEIGCADGIAECDADNDGLGDICDPCPVDASNVCFGPVALDNTAGVDIRINADGGSLEPCAGDRTDCRGETWVADFGAPGSATGYNQAGDPENCDLVAGCPVDTTTVFGCTDTATGDLFRCGHADPALPPNLIYSFDLPDGDYLLNLLFMNGSTTTANPGERVFSVAINGAVPAQLSSFDPVEAAGGVCDPGGAPCVPVNRSAVLAVSGGAGLEVEFLAEVGAPAIKGIEVLCATSVWHRDQDGDGFGDPGVPIEACYQPVGYVLDATDCNDTDAGAYPGAAEVCDGVDNDCNELTDEDLDGDGYGACSDCDEADPCQWAVPTEARNLRFQDRDRVLWDEPVDLGGLFGRYSGLRSSQASDFSTAQCIETNFQVNAFVDSTVPPAGQVRYYLVRANSSCGAGAHGNDSAGVPRQGPTCLGLGAGGCSGGLP